MEAEYPLGDTLRNRREELNLGVRELCRKIEKNLVAGHKVSPSYYSQVENQSKIRPDKITMDFLWAVSTVLELNPMELFVMTRPQIPHDLAMAFIKRVTK